MESEQRKTNGTQVSSTQAGSTQAGSTRTKVSSQQQPAKSSISTKSYAWSSRPSANKKTSPNASSSTSKFSYSSVPMTTSTTPTVSELIASHSLGPTIEAETRVVTTFKVKSHHTYDSQKGDPTVSTTTSTSINGGPKQTVYNNGGPFGKSADPKLQSLLARNKDVASTRSNNNKNIEPTPKTDSNKNVTTSNMYVGNGKRNSAPNKKMAVWEIENLMRDVDSEENLKKETLVEVSPKSQKETLVEVSSKSKKETEHIPEYSLKYKSASVDSGIASDTNGSTVSEVQRSIMTLTLAGSNEGSPPIIPATEQTVIVNTQQGTYSARERENQQRPSVKERENGQHPKGFLSTTSVRLDDNRNKQITGK